jgi:phosphatidylinositol alpha-1,6-mannosyltransferase
MNLAVVTEAVSNRSGSRAPLELSKALAARGHAVSVYARDSGSDPAVLDDLSAHGVTVEVLPGSRRAAAAELARRLAAARPGTASLHCTLPMALAVKASGVPALYTYYGTPVGIVTDRIAAAPTRSYAGLDALARRLAFLRDRRLLHAAGRGVTISRACAALARTALGSNLPVVPLGIHRKPESGSPANPSRLLSVSRFVPSKGFHVLLAAWERLRVRFPDVAFDVVGASANPRYLRWLRQTYPEATFHVDVDDAGLDALYRNAAVYVTADRNLFFGLPVLEAAASGVPSVTLDYAAAREVIADGETGYVAENPEQLEAHVAAILSDAALRNRLGAAARTRLEREFSWSRAAEQWEPLLAAVGTGA